MATSTLHTYDLALDTFGDTDLRPMLPTNAQVEYIDLTAVSIVNEAGAVFDLKIPSVVRFAPRSHVGMQYASSWYAARNAKKIADTFDTEISFALSADGHTLTSVFQCSGQTSEPPHQWRTNTLTLKVYYSLPTGLLLPQRLNYGSYDNLPQYRYHTNQSVGAVRVLGLESSPTNPDFTNLLTDPPLDGFAITNIARDALGVGVGGYVIPHPNGTINYYPHDDFHALFEAVPAPDPT